MDFTLKGKTQKGKNRIREHGQNWKLVRNGYAIKGSLLLKSIQTDYMMWIAVNNDKDFETI